MLLCAEYVLPITSDPIEKGAVLVRDGKICDLGPAAQLRSRYEDEEVRDFAQAALMPGLINVHTHMEYSVMRGMAPDEPYAAWLAAVSDIEESLTESDLYYSAIIGGLEAISSGITLLGDTSTTDTAARALHELGLRGVVYRETGAMDKRQIAAAMDAAIADIERWRSLVDGDRITIGIAPSALHECHPSIFRLISDYAGDSVPVAMHLAGSREEYDFVKSGSSAFSLAKMERHGCIEFPPWLPTGVTPVNYALNWGAFEAGNVLAIHCVHVDNDDILKLRDRDVAVAFCPRCNSQLGMGVAPIGEYLRAGLRVGLGTDSPAATDSTDMFSEMRIGLMVQRAVSTQDFLPAHTMLEMATIGGARALRLDDKLGSLEVGKLADITAVDLSGSHQTPTDNPMSAVVNTAGNSDVVMTMVGGTILYEQGKWNIDVEFAKSIAQVMKVRGKLRH